MTRRFKHLWKVLALSVLTVAAVAGIQAAPAAAADITLTYATNTAPLGLRGEAEKMFLDEIEKQSGGRIKVQPYWGQSLLKGKEILKGIQQGVVDMGEVNINYYPKRLLLNGAVVLVQRGPVDYANKMWVYDTMFKEVPILNEEFSKFGQQIVYTYAVLPTTIAFTQPVTSLSQFKDQRVRASSRWALAMLKGAGATPVSIPWGDCYMALETKAVEGVLSNYDSINRTKLDEVGPNVFVMKEIWMATPYLVTINQRKWKGLPQWAKDAIQKAAEVSRAQFTKNYDKWFDRTVEAEKKMGCTVTFASPEDIKAWTTQASVKEIEDQWCKEAAEAGAKDPQAVLAKVKDIVARGIAKDKN